MKAIPNLLQGIPLFIFGATFHVTIGKSSLGPGGVEIGLVLEIISSVWIPHYKKEVEALERIPKGQRRW